MTLDEVTRIKETVEEEWLGIPGVTGVDVGRSELTAGEPSTPAIRVYVEDRAEFLRRAALPTEIEGAPVVVIERRFRLH
jgi:hypothetical protein